MTEFVEEGFFTVDHDLNLLFAESTMHGKLLPFVSSPLPPAPANTVIPNGLSLWEVFTGPLRPPLFAVYKRLLKGENNAEWEISADGVRYLLRTFSTKDGYATYYQAIREQDALPSVSEAHPHPKLSLPREVESDAFFQHSSDIMCIMGESGDFERVNPTAMQLFGLNHSILPSLFDVIHPEERDNAKRLLFPPAAMLANREQGSIGLLCRCLSAAGEYRWLQWSIDAATIGGKRRFYAVARDITVFKRREEEMSRQVQHDPLTNLPNRLLLLNHLHFCLTSASRRKHNVAVLFLDLDRFKKVNDTFGHPTGDQLLRDVADKMRTALRDEDMIARLGGDEFVIVLPFVRDANDAIRVAQKILSLFVRPFSLRGNPVMLSVSIGISIAPMDGQTPEVLIQHADDAMYRAKRSGIGTYALHDAKEVQTGRFTTPIDQFSLEARLSQALQRDELLLHYQPQIDLKRGRMIGVEALMRWNPLEMEPVSPSTFIPLAEETGLIVPMGTWAVREASRQAVDWYRNGYPVQMSVNLAAAQLSDRSFPEKLSDYLKQVGLPAHMIDLELTERTFIEVDKTVIAVMNDLRDMGVHLSIDDFGMAYSWFPYLKTMPIDGIKVDRSFVSNIVTSTADEAVVKAIVELSHTLGLKVIAEGVETIAQRDCLLYLGCDVMQGFLFSAAVPPGDVASMLRDRNRD